MTFAYTGPPLSKKMTRLHSGMGENERKTAPGGSDVRSENWRKEAQEKDITWEDLRMPSDARNGFAKQGSGCSFTGDYTRFPRAENG